MLTNQTQYIRVQSFLFVIWILIGIQGMVYGDVTPVNERTQQVRDAIVASVTEASTAEDVTETQLASITELNLRNKEISTLQSGDFSGMTALTNINLYDNNLYNLPDRIFHGLTALTTLRLGRNEVDPMPLVVYLEEVGQDQFKVVIPTGAPFDISFPINVISDGTTSVATNITISTGSLESELFTISFPQDTTVTQYFEIGTLPTLPRNHYGYTFARSTACHRTPAVRRAILNAISGVDECREVTDEHLSSIHTLNLEYAGLSELRSDDFSGLTSLRTLYLGNNNLTTLPAGIFSDLSNLRDLYIQANNLNSLPESVFSSLSSVRLLSLHNNELTTLPKDLFSGLPSLTQVFLQDNHLTTLDADIFSNAPTISNLYLNNNRLTTLPEKLFSNITSLEQLLLNSNRLTNIPTGVFRGMSTPNYLWIHNNRLIILPLIISLEKVSEGEFKVVVPSGTPIDISLNITVTNGTLNTDSYAITVAAGSVESESLTVTQTGDSSNDVTVDFDILTTPPQNHLGYNLTKSASLPLKVIGGINAAPVFTEGDATTRSVSENTVANVDIGTAVTATDANNDTLTYTLGGTDADSFEIDSTDGQLKTKAALDYETKKVYTVMISVSDESLTDSITVTINITDIDETIPNRAPVFSDGDSTSRSVAENTDVGANIDTPVSATDADGNTLKYTLSGTDASSFAIEESTGQLKTKAALDYETKKSYTVTITVSDGSLTDTIGVAISVTDVNEAPVFADGENATRDVAENTDAGTNIGVAVSATDVDDPSLTYTLGGTDAASFDLDDSSGQLKTKAPLDYETKKSYTVTITVSDGSLTDMINVVIIVSNINEAPVFTEGESTTRTVTENTLGGVEIGNAVTATDVDGDALTYILSGADAALFELEDASGQLKTKTLLDFETQSTFKVTITVTDEKLTDSIEVTITVIDIDETIPNRAPIFSDGDSTTRSVAENTDVGANIGTPVSATDADGNTLKYTLNGTDASSFAIEESTGQLKTKAALDHETKKSYRVTITVSDGSLTDTIIVAISVTNVNEAPVFREGENATRNVSENTVAGTNIGAAVSATDVDDPSLTYTLGGPDAASFDLDDSSGQLKTKASLDYETKKSYIVTITVTDDKLTDSIEVTITVIDIDETIPNRAPEFSDGDSTTRSVAENTDVGANIGTPVSATDADGNTLKYTLSGTDASSFAIEESTGQLRTKAELDHETKKSYTVTITVSDGSLTDTIIVVISVTNVNEAPVFVDGENATRNVSENTVAGTNIGAAVSATDVDDPSLTYTLGGPDAASFDLDDSSGQLKTNAALDYETKKSYTVTITVSDGSLTDTISVAISVTNVNEAPVFTDGENATRSVAENTVAGTNIGAAVSASDVDNPSLTYTLGDTDAASFDLDDSSGQLKTKAALDYETKKSYTVTITVSDGSLTDTISVLINVTDVNEAPVFTEGETATRSVAENADAGTNIGAAVSATDVDDISLTYTLSGTDAASFDIIDTSGQLRTKAALDYETKKSYTVTITVSDDKLTDSIEVTITVIDIDETVPNRAPEFSDGDSTTRSVAENTDVGTNIGTPVSATDVDGNTLKYTLSGTDASSFAIEESTGQLKTMSSLNYENKKIYAVIITVSDGSLTDTINVKINILDINDAPVFKDGNEASRSILENTDSGVSIGTPISATDEDNDILTYSLSGTDASLFGIDRETGQLETSAALDFEIKSSYSVIVSVADEDDATVVIPVMITITDRNDAPEFSEGDSTTRSVAENTSSEENIGSPVSATDDDNDTLEYELSDTASSLFAIDSATGQLKTEAALDFETKSSYSVTISVTDGNGGSDSIIVAINITDVDEDISSPELAGVCGRTQQVRDEIVAEAGVDDCSQVTAEHLAAITILNLQEKSITSLKSGDFYGMINLDTLRLWDNQLTSLPEDIFDELTSMTRLKLERNQLTTLPEDIFDGLSSLESIWLQGNQISSLPEDIFDGLSSLNFITITDNKLTSLPEDIFEGLSSLELLTMGTNQMTSIHQDLFDGLSSLVSLYISSNKLTVLPLDIFDGLSSLNHISLGSNQINSISTDHFDGLSSLKNIDLSANELTSLPEEIFDGMSDLERLSLQGNKFTDTSLHVDVFDGLSSLKYLSLQHNEFTTLQQDLFDGLSSLVFLSLNSNKFTSLPEDLFDELSSLETLELQWNVSLTSLHEDLFDGLSSIEKLVLHNTGLTSLPTKIFSGLSSLTDLELYDTQITSLPDGILSGLSSLTTLTFAKFRDEILSFTVSLEKVGDNQFKAVIPVGAPFSIELPISVTNGSISGGTTSLTISTGSIESTTLTITRSSGTTAAITVDIGILPAIPASHNGYILSKSAELPLEVVSATGSAPTLVNNTNLQIPNETSLLSNYPNPFNPETWIPYQLAKSTEVSLTIYNLHGFVVRQVLLGHRPAGLYHDRSRAIYWDGRNTNGERVASGVYFYVLKAGDYSATRIMLIRK